MSERACVDLLRWALPRLHLRWAGFERNKRQVCRRIAHRRAALGLRDLAAYRGWLDAHPDEWAVLDAMCRVTISRFGRDRAVWTALVDDVLPRLAREADVAGRPTVTAWSAGCGAGEEPFTLAIAWMLAVAPSWPGLALDVLATDVDDVQLGRAAAAGYPEAALTELPPSWRDAAFEHVGGPARASERLRQRFKAPVRFAHHDVRTAPPGQPFDLVLCRNLAFTYFDAPLQRAVAITLRSALRDGGVLVVARDERVPEGVPGLVLSSPSIYLAAPLQG